MWGNETWWGNNYVRPDALRAACWKPLPCTTPMPCAGVETANYNSLAALVIVRLASLDCRQNVRRPREQIGASPLSAARR